MKKLILSLLIMCSALAYSQGTIPIPQIIGLPSALASKVDKVTGKSLVADTSIVKLTGVQAGAQVNKIEGIQKNGADLTITGKKVNITVPTTASDISAEPANTNIQSHISSTSNPHSVTKSQVGLGNVDNTSDINKPISTATQTALDGKQLIGTYATGTGTASGTNTGDETLTSIKTKLGAATAVSDGYLKYQDYVKFDGKLSSEVDGSTTNELQTISTSGAAGNITLSNSGGTLNLNVNDADASATNEIQDLSLSGNTLSLSSDVTTVDISQATAVLANTAKVSNATHTGDVTGSTALTLATVNSNVGTFNNVTINAKGLATAGSNVSYEPAFTKNTAFNKNFGTTPGTVLEGRTFGTAANSAVGDFILNQNSSAQSANMWIIGTNRSGYQIIGTNATATQYLSRWGNGTNEGFLDLNTGGAIIGSSTGYLQLYSSGGQALQLNVDKSATFSSTVNSTGFLLNGNNLTSSLTTNYIPKWNGSTFVNATAGTDYQRPITLTTNGTSGAATLSGNVLNVPNYTASGSFIQNQSASAQSGSLWVSGNIISNDKIEGITISTERVDINTSGAQINFYGTSGSGVLSQPFRGLNYKKVMIYLANFVGNNNINYLTAFTYPPAIVITDGLSSSLITSKSTTSVTITSASSATGILILEGY